MRTSLKLAWEPMERVLVTTWAYLGPRRRSRMRSRRQRWASCSLVRSSGLKRAVNVATCRAYTARKGHSDDVIARTRSLRLGGWWGSVKRSADDPSYSSSCITAIVKNSSGGLKPSAAEFIAELEASADGSTPDNLTHVECWTFTFSGLTSYYDARRLIGYSARDALSSAAAAASAAAATLSCTHGVPGSDANASHVRLRRPSGQLSNQPWR